MPRKADEATRSLCEWIVSLFPEAPVAIRSAADSGPRKGIEVRLINAAHVATPRAVPPSVTLRLDYLVSVAFDDPLEEHRILGELLFAAAAQPDVQVVPREEAERWRLAHTGADGLVLSVQLRRDRELRPAPLVESPLVVEGSSLRILRGVVLGPGDVPIADAIVQLPTLNLSAITDHRGRFTFAGAPADRPLRLKATKNRTTVDISATADGPVTIRIPMEG